MSLDDFPWRITGKEDHNKLLEYTHDAYRPVMLRYFTRMRVESPEDAAQNFFFKVYRSLHHFDPSKSNYNRWLFTIAERIALDDIDKNQRWRRRQTLILATHNTLPDPAEKALQHDLTSILRSALSKLQEGTALVLNARYFEELTESEIAEKLNIPRGTVKSRHYNGIRQLSKILSPELLYDLS